MFSLCANVAYEEIALVLYGKSVSLYKTALRNQFLHKLKLKIKAFVLESFYSSNDLSSASFHLKFSLIQYFFSFMDKPNFCDLKITYKVRRSKLKVKINANFLQKLLRYQCAIENKVDLSQKLYSLKYLCIYSLFPRLYGNEFNRLLARLSLTKKRKDKFCKHYIASYYQNFKSRRNYEF